MPASRGPLAGKVVVTALAILRATTPLSGWVARLEARR